MLEELQALDPEKKNMVRFIDNFMFQDVSCLAFKMLDRSLSQHYACQPPGSAVHGEINQLWFGTSGIQSKHWNDLASLCIWGSRGDPGPPHIWSHQHAGTVAWHTSFLAQNSSLENVHTTRWKLFAICSVSQETTCWVPGRTPGSHFSRAPSIQDGDLRHQRSTRRQLVSKPKISERVLDMVRNLDEAVESYPEKRWWQCWAWGQGGIFTPPKTVAASGSWGENPSQGSSKTVSLLWLTWQRTWTPALIQMLLLSSWPSPPWMIHTNLIILSATLKWT